MRIGVMFSSGKDSTNTLWYYLEQGWDVRCLLSLLPENPDSYMFQSPDKNLVKKQAISLGFPLILQTTKGEEEKELEDLKSLFLKAKEQYDIQGVVVGALASDYQHERVTRICHDVGLKTYSPLWHKNQSALMREMISSGFDIRMTRVAAEGLDSSWLGKQLTLDDMDRLDDLHKRVGLHPGGEGGEFETIVLDGPIFTAPIEISFEKVMESEFRGELQL